jgi:hypothetical protein
VALLRKEFRILKLLEESGVAPKPVDFFEDWEHWFLVEEYVEGETLRGFVNARGIALRIDPTIEEAREFYGIYRQLYAQVARHLEVLHQHHLIFTDMSHNNVIVSADGSTVRFIDFEGAREVGVDQPTSFYTPGFAPPELIAGRTARREDDSFGFGALMLAGLIPATDLMVLEPTSHLRLVEGFTRDLGLPADLGDAILKLMAADKSQRMPLLEAIRILEADTPVHAPTIGSLDPAPVDTAALLDRMMRHLKAVQTPQRRDRLFPASPELWATNPLSLAHGACGVAAVLQRVQGEVPAEVTDWILSHEVTTESYAPGLFLGMGGIAWALLDLGYGEAAARIGRASAEHPLLWESPDLYSGAAGWGLSQLKLALELRDDEFLRNAVRAGEFLLSTRLRDDETGASWWVNAGKESCNLGHGAAGVSLFLLYLYRATGDERYLEAGEEGITYVLNRSLETFDGGMTWVIEEGHRTYTPYWRWGSSGIGMVLIRYLHATGDSRYSDALQKVMIDADRKYSIFPGRFGGLAGVGEFWLDLERFGYEPERARRGARKALEGVLMFRVEREAGTTFCGDSRMRVSCDYGSGSAGIAAFIHRLQTSAAPMFMLDELLDDVSSRAIEIPNIEIASGAATIGA